MKILMLGWELPPHNAGGLGVACAHMCRALASQGADIDFIVPYINSHPDIDFMRVIPAIPADAREVMKHSGAYDSFYYQSKTGKKHEIAANDPGVTYRAHTTPTKTAAQAAARSQDTCSRRRRYTRSMSLV